MSESVFGQILGADIAQDAMEEHLKLWLPTYLAEVDGQRGRTRGSTAKPRSWQVVPVFDNTLDGQLPAILIISPGMADIPQKLGDGSYLATYTLGVVALVKGPDQITANNIAKRYGAAIASAVMEHKSLGVDNVEQISWQGDSYDDVPAVTDRTLSSATVHFNVQFRGVLTEYAGPHIPIITPDPGEQPKEDPTEQYHPPWGPIPDEEHVVVTLVRKD